MSELKYKAGDRVRIKSLDWYNENKNENNGVQCGNFTFYAAQYCGFTVTIALVNMNAGCYIMKEIDDVWTDEMIEGLVEEETKPDKVIEEAKTYWDSIKDAWICPDGYQFVDENGNVINTTKIVLEKKIKYPKTYEECCKVIGINRHDVEIYLPQPYQQKMFNLFKLLICRDAYWKLYGEEMGLGKAWEPDWKNHNIKYVLYNQEGAIDSMNTSGPRNYILAFPTPEMRDAFYENFKKDIEICKELL